MGLAARVDGEGVECEEVDCECRADLLLSGGSVAVGGWLIDWRLSKQEQVRFRFVSDHCGLLFAFWALLSFLPLFSVRSLLLLGGILPAKFTGPDWPVRGSSFG